MTRQLLAFSKPSVGKTCVLDLNDVVQGLQKFLRRLLTDNINLELPLSDASNIKADKGHIEQIITNLVVNARDAMSEGGTLIIETQNRDEWVELRVIDAGCGMSEEVSAHIFEPFYSTKTKDKGTGLGLATVYGLVKNYGGTIDVDSVVGEGTTITIRFRSTKEVATETSERPPALREHDGRTILLVEDDAQIRSIVAGLLVRHGHRVIDVANGEDAVEVIGSEQDVIDLLVSDILMPGINGNEVAAEMAKQRPMTKILLMTGYADSAVLLAAQDAGRELLNKPFTPEQLLIRVGELLD